MANNKPTSYEEFEAELLQDPVIRREYDILKPKYDMIQKLIERRNELCLSQLQLAAIVGMKQPAIARLESGLNNVNVGTLFKVTNALGLDVEFKPRTTVRV